jgi:hypothetical protein
MLSSLLFLFDGFVLLRAGFKTPEDRKLLRTAYLTFGTILSASIAGLIAWYVSVSVG